MLDPLLTFPDPAPAEPVPTAAELAARRRAARGVWRGQVDDSRFDELDDEIAREFGLHE